MSTTPNPGSDEALEMSCTCPVLDNGGGKRGDGLFWFTVGCPVHHTTSKTGVGSPAALDGLGRVQPGPECDMWDCPIDCDVCGEKTGDAPEREQGAPSSHREGESK